MSEASDALVGANVAPSSSAADHGVTEETIATILEGMDIKGLRYNP